MNWSTKSHRVRTCRPKSEEDVFNSWSAV